MSPLGPNQANVVAQKQVFSGISPEVSDFIAASTIANMHSSISEWFKVASHATWQNLVEVRQVYPHADFVDPFTIFNIKGDAYRLIVKIEYRWQMIFVKHLLSHADYDKGGWKI